MGLKIKKIDELFCFLVMFWPNIVTIQTNRASSPRNLILIEFKTFSKNQPMRVQQQVAIALPWPMGKPMIWHHHTSKLTITVGFNIIQALFFFFFFFYITIACFNKVWFYLPLRVSFCLVRNSHNDAAAACLWLVQTTRFQPDFAPIRSSPTNLQVIHDFEKSATRHGLVM